MLYGQLENLVKNAVYLILAGFDYMTLIWCLKVLEKKGASQIFISRLRNLYCNNLIVVVVINVPGAAVPNVRLTHRQGDVPSMELFCFGIDPLLSCLERVLQGILIASVPVQGPRLQQGETLPPVEQRYKLIGYADDVKPAITTMEEFTTVDSSISLYLYTHLIRNASSSHFAHGALFSSKLIFPANT